ncbi:unnamed protein product [Cuscuta campestris]|uniref:SET domain-containing protein n=1 Tax=Cuscuta campestris TaxID=132261 RepID=A0A484MF29_9ASTE|nr:unnamed protein product [Cuscuta campestris]
MGRRSDAENETKKKPRKCEVRAEFHLLRHSSAIPDTSDLCLSLRLLSRFQILGLVSENDGILDRIGGLVTNRAELLMMPESREDSVAHEVFEKIKEGARAMAAARRMLLNSESPLAGACNLEEAVLCLVLTNAVEVQDSAGCSVGVAVYGQSFSWINHGCSPNCSYRSSTIPGTISAMPWRMHPKYTDGDGGNGSEPINTRPSLEFLSSPGTGEECGPRLIVRSIKDIKKGEEVLITYTDLLQPKGMRQSELWLKYRFRCCCDRCNAKTYVDHILEELSFKNLECSSLTTSGKFNWDFTMEKLVEWFDDAVDDFLTSNNPISCSSKLENLLTYGHLVEDKCHLLKLHPFHHLSLNAYTVLASAYKALASEPLPSNHGNDMCRLKSLGFSKASAGYSLLLAGSAHHLFLFEPSLIVSAATFWTAAGEALLSLVTEHVPFSSQSCDKCTTLHKRDLNFELQEMTQQFMNCITDYIPKVWHILAEEGPFLKLVKDPIDFKWIGSTEFSVLDPPVHVADSSELKSSAETEGVDLNHGRECLFQVGLHCSLYGSFLSSVCSAS